MQSIDSSSPFAVGFELEITLQPRANTILELVKDFGFQIKPAEPLDRLNNANAIHRYLKHHLNHGLTDTGAYSQWNVVANDTVVFVNPFYGAEIQSPKLSTLDLSQSAICHMFNTLTLHFEIADNTSCGTHVHVSRGNLRWSLVDLRSIARAIITFSSTCPSLYPTRETKYCQPNSEVKGKMARYYIGNNYTGALEQVDSLERRPLIEYISPDRRTLINFRSLWPMEDRRDTIEFQLFPSTTSSTTLQQYILFSSAFLSAALRVRPTYYIDELQNATLDDFQSFITPPRGPEGFDIATLFGGKIYNRDMKRAQLQLLAVEWYDEDDRLATWTPPPIPEEVETPWDDIVGHNADF